MSRRVSRTSAALLALTLVLSTPSVFAAPTRESNPDNIFGISRIVRVIKKVVRNLTSATNDGDSGVTYPTPPKP